MSADPSLPDRSPDVTGGPPSTPGWVKALGVVVFVLVVGVVAAALLGGQHGPGLHSGQGAPRELSAVDAVS
ncbi:hypothetical protein [Aquipuribacter hungaricus]|uniref:Uncharacterized protein n=1 Tax=Aquipuribacter hungaricus TaxID=545624 RepID=A0ABV7WH60_9MICO